MPRITDELRALLEQVKSLAKPAVVRWSLTCFSRRAQWEASESASFMLNGVPLLQALNASGGSARVVTSP